MFVRWGMKSVLSISRGPMSCLAWLKLMPTRPPPSGGGGGQFELTRHSDPPVTTLISFPSPSLLLSFLFFPRSTMEEAKASNTCRGRRRDGMYACGLSYLHPEHGLRYKFGFPATGTTQEEVRIYSRGQNHLVAFRWRPPGEFPMHKHGRERESGGENGTNRSGGRKERKKSFWNALNS